MKRITAAFLSASLVFCLQPFPVQATDGDVFFEDFSGTKLDSSKWLIAEKNWGGTVTENGKTVDYNGGVIAENVAVRDGKLVLTGCGNRYEGDLRGINRNGSRRADGKRCGGAIATKAYFGSGSYEIRARIAPQFGCCSAMWTFEYEEAYSGDSLTITNHEIDIEFPGRDKNDDFSLSHALCTTWVTEEDYKTKSVSCGEQADGKFHTYRFDWHTGSETETPRVEYYFDNALIYTADTWIPTNESRFWLGLWFPKNWAGTPDFDTASFEIDYVKITPFHETGDTPQHESYPDSGWAQQTAEMPEGWLLWHSYSSYAAQDSKLYLRSPDGTVKEVSGDFVHAMNGSFGPSPEQFTFMAIDRRADEWDIFLSQNGTVTNLTQNSGFRNEDPKLSPDGKYIVFKRGRWDSEAGDFVYNLALLDPDTKAVTMLTDDAAEEAMPCFSDDGKTIFFTGYTDGIGSIYRMDTASRKTETVFSEKGVNAYYPIVQGDRLYFTKWYSAENHSDQLMCTDGKTLTALPCNTASYDCSDACPVRDTAMIYSSTANGSYDLYFYDGKDSFRLDALSSGNQELGADFYALDEYEKHPAKGDVNGDGICNAADAALLRTWLLAVPDTDLKQPDAADCHADRKLNATDLCLLKRKLQIRS